MGDQNLLSRARASEGTLSCWFRLYLQSLASTPVLNGLTLGRRPVGKVNPESLSLDENMLYRPHLVG
jgi:hypothetical protein